MYATIDNVKVTAQGTKVKMSLSGFHPVLLAAIENARYTNNTELLAVLLVLRASIDSQIQN